jgi:hypothetical protein
MNVLIAGQNDIITASAKLGDRVPYGVLSMMSFIQGPSVWLFALRWSDYEP